MRFAVGYSLSEGFGLASASVSVNLKLNYRGQRHNSDKILLIIDT